MNHSLNLTKLAEKCLERHYDFKAASLRVLRSSFLDLQREEGTSDEYCITKKYLMNGGELTQVR